MKISKIWEDTQKKNLDKIDELKSNLEKEKEKIFAEQEIMLRDDMQLIDSSILTLETEKSSHTIYCSDNCQNIEKCTWHIEVPRCLAVAPGPICPRYNKPAGTSVIVNKTFVVEDEKESNNV